MSIDQPSYSIITPIYNEEISLPGYFDAVERVDYPCDLLQIVFVNDGSTDSSLSLLQQYQSQGKFRVEIVNLDENRGWIFARIIGAEKAIFDNLVLLDAKCELFENALREISVLNYQPVVFNVLQKREGIIDRFMYVLRNQLYSPYFGLDFKDVLITPENFDHIPKGTTGLFIDRSLFLSSQPKHTEKFRSDDIQLLHNVVRKKALLKSAKVCLYYNTRKGYKANMLHLMSRGPRFVDYYFDPQKRYFWLIPASFLLLFGGAALFIWQWKIAVSLVLGFTILAVVYLLWIGKNKLIDVAAFIIGAPFMVLFFSLGILKGVIIRMSNKVKQD